MKLRHRLALSFAIATSGILVASRLVTIESFRRIQEYELDQGLRARAEREGSDVALVGRSALERDYDAQGEVDPLEQLVTYGALYREDGSLIADTESFANAPSLREIGMTPGPSFRPPARCFDFRFRGQLLRGVLVDVRGLKPTDRQFLLLAASRRDMDADARGLLALGWWVLGASITISVGIGWWLGRAMTRGVESLASWAREVATGKLDEPFDPSHSRDEEVRALGTVLSDMVTRLKSLVETERRFAAHAAHELRSPLTALRGEIELALRRPRSPTEYETTLREALEDTNRLINLSEDLLIVARTAGSSKEPQEDECSVSEIIREAIQSSHATPNQVQVDVRDERVFGTRTDLTRMLRNLVDNAVGHGKTDVRIRARAAYFDDRAWLRIEVEDDGPGVPEQDRPRIFEHFHRGAEARENSGAGLGLGIAREIARRHGGDIELESKAKPTRFVVKIPRVGPHAIVQSR